MSKKTQPDQPADDWAGLAQNLFGINLDKATGDDDLLDDDMFKVELPKPPEPPAVIPPPPAAIPQSEVEFAPFEEPMTAPPNLAPPPVAAPRPPVKPAPHRVVKASITSDDDSFGVGILEEEANVSADTLAAECSTAEVSFNLDDGLTLPEDYDAEGLTLPADYDDGLTLAPESTVASDNLADGEEDEDEEDEENDTEVLASERSTEAAEGQSDSRRRRQPRRTREDAYWDMLENWEWEEIPDSDSPSGEGERPRSQSGDRGGRSGRSDRGGRGGDRGSRGRGRDERPRSENRPSAEQRPLRDEQRPAESAPAAGSEAAEQTRRPERGGRPRDDRGPRQDRPRGERRPERDDRRRDEPRQAPPIGQTAPPAGQSTSRANHPAPTSASGCDDFGSGIFEEQPQIAPPLASKTNEIPGRRPREESIPQSSRAADAVLKSGSGLTRQPIEDELVWPDEDSDVRPAPVGSVVETSGLPPAEAAGESDETISDSDVQPLREDNREDNNTRRPRRRRGRREPRSESRGAPPPDGNEGTMFDLSDALATGGESPDFIPSAVGDDSATSDGLGDERSADGVTDEERSSEQRGGRRRRRRRRRPGEEGPAGEATSSPDREPSEEAGVAETGEASNEDDYVLKPITYSNIPSWEEAIRYLLQPQLVGRNLGPDDADESLVNDPRGSGGAEPTPPPPPPRRGGGGGGGRGRGRRP